MHTWGLSPSVHVGYVMVCATSLRLSSEGSGLSIAKVRDTLARGEKTED